MLKPRLFKETGETQKWFVTLIDSMLSALALAIPAMAASYDMVILKCRTTMELPAR